MAYLNGKMEGFLKGKKTLNSILKERPEYDINDS